MRTLYVIILLAIALCSTDAEAQVARLQNDTLRFKACEEGEILLMYDYAGCDAAAADSILIEGIPASNYRVELNDRLLLDGEHDTSRVRFFSKTSGVHHVTVRAGARHSDWLRADSLFSIVVIVEPNPGRLVSNFPDTLDFGLQSMCVAQLVSEELILRNAGCEDLNIESIRLELDQLPATEYGFTPVANVVLAGGGEALTLPITFKPEQARISTGRLILTIGGSFDTVHVRGGGIDETRSVSLKADTLKVAMCESGEAVIEIANQSCRLITIDAMDIPAPLELLPGQLPIGVQSGKSVQLRVRYTPGAEGPKQVDALTSMRFIGQNETIAFDTVLPLNVYGLNGLPLTATSDTTIDVGEVSICSERSFDVMISSIGCDTLTVSSANISSSDQGFAIVRQPNVTVPQGESTGVGIHFIPPAVGPFSTELIVMTNAGTRKITLTGRGVGGTRALASSISTLDFGETNICEERDSVVRLTNTGCDTLTITDAEIDKNFSFSGDLPIRLAPGESVELPITTQVDTTGKPTRLTGVLTIASNADNQLAPITLTRGLYYPTKLRIEAVDEASGKAGDEARFRIILEGEVPPTMTALHFDFLHNNDLLSFKSLSGTGLQVVNTVGDAEQRQSFMLSPVRAGVLGELTFKAYLAEAEQTTLSFDNITFESEGVGFASECIAVISDSGSRFNYVYECGDGMIRSTLRGETLIKSLTPNPATNEIRVELASGVSEAEIVIVDMLGAEVRRTSGNIIDISQLASGTYFLRVTANGAVQTRRVIVSR